MSVVVQNTGTLAADYQLQVAHIALSKVRTCTQEIKKFLEVKHFE